MAADHSVLVRLASLLLAGQVVALTPARQLVSVARGDVGLQCVVPADAALKVQMV